MTHVSTRAVSRGGMTLLLLLALTRAAQPVHAQVFSIDPTATITGQGIDRGALVTGIVDCPAGFSAHIQVNLLQSDAAPRQGVVLSNVQHGETVVICSSAPQAWSLVTALIPGSPPTRPLMAGDAHEGRNLVLYELIVYDTDDHPVFHFNSAGNITLGRETRTP